MQLDFIQSLNEARLTRGSSDERILTYNDCCEKFYLIILTLNFMRNFPHNSPFVRKYAKNSLFTNYTIFKTSGTDLYNLIYFITGDETALAKLKDPDAAKTLQQKRTFPLPNIKEFLQQLSTGNIPVNAQRTLIKVENGLDIENSEYKTIRRNIGNIHTLKEKAIKQIATKLLFAARAKLRSSDIIEHLSKFIGQYDFESYATKDTEPQFTNQDIDVDNRSLLLYRLLTKETNIMLIKGFLENVAEGKSIPSTMVKAYAPVVKIVDDIIKGGPGYIEMLKVIQKRAKNNKY
jgi:hypothetical protein